MTSRITDSTSLGLGLFCASVLLYSLNERTYRTIKADETDDASNHQPKETSVNANVNDNGNNDCDIPSQITLEGTDDESKEISLTRRVQAPNTITIAYASTTGTCKGFAETLETKLQKLIALKKSNCIIQLVTVDQLDWWDELLNDEEEEETTAGTPNDTSPIVLFVLPTWTDGTLPEPYNILLTSLNDIANDWRIAPKPLRKGSTQDKTLYNPTPLIGAFGMGSKAYDVKTFGKPAKHVFSTLMKLGARSLVPSQGRRVVCIGDEDGGGAEELFETWLGWVLESVKSQLPVVVAKGKRVKGKKVKVMEVIAEDGGGGKGDVGCCQKQSSDNDGGGGGGGGCGCKEDTSTTNESDAVGCCSTIPETKEADPDDYEDYSVEDDDDYPSSSEDEYEDEEKEPDVMDLEDIGTAMHESKQKPKAPKEMVTAKQKAQLSKEGYKIIGTHSAVKLCRWTKHQLRGRGGCYKHTFYGITSYQCMEATPSLACANKCKFIVLLFWCVSHD